MTAPTPSRMEFVAAYMARSGVTEYKLDGEVVSFCGATRLALACDCGEDGCEGWAMVRPEERQHHLNQQGGG